MTKQFWRTNEGEITAVNVFLNLGEWCYAAMTADGYDHGDTLCCADDASEDVAMAEAQEQFPVATVTRVADTDIA